MYDVKEATIIKTTLSCIKIKGKESRSRILASKTMTRRQIGLRARNKLAQLSPNSRGRLANVPRLLEPPSSSYFSLSLSLYQRLGTRLEIFPGLTTVGKKWREKSVKIMKETQENKKNKSESPKLDSN